MGIAPTPRADADRARPSELPANAAAAREAIDAWSRSIARDAINANALVGQLKGNKAFIGQATRDYAGRFIFELLQNAYDAHPRGAKGAVHILLDAAAAEHGVLYVANAGAPFDFEDFRAISEIAQSSKQPGEGIGNKGVGFKSVLQVSEWPEIYSSSAAPSRDGFHGYCFGFARHEDMLRLADGDAAAAGLLDDRVSRYALPVIVDDQDDNVRAFAAAGMKTVCRLPLRSTIALGLAKDQIREILASSAPVLLFLDRIATLGLEIRGSDALDEVLIRDSRVLDGPEAVDLEEVNLGPSGQFLMLQRGVAHEAFLAAIRASIDAQLIDPEWESWKQDVSVSVALRTDADLSEGRLYCFLPMGSQATAPMAAHVNAPFAVRLARDGLVDGVPLNDLLFASVADACAVAGPYLRSHARSRSLVPDLLIWSSKVQVICDAFSHTGSDLADAPVIPVLGGKGWASLKDSYFWDDGAATVMTADRIAQATSIPLLDGSIGIDRVGRVRKLHSAMMKVDMDPSVETKADWAEAVAGLLRDVARRHSDKFDPQPWLMFYDELATRFASNGGQLAGRSILIDDNLELQPCWGGAPDEGRAAPAIFFQARGDDADEETDTAADVSIPASLRKHLAYMHSGLDWHVPSAQGRPENRPGRRFLESQSLVRPFRRQGLFERIRDVLAKSTSKQVRGDALRLVFNLEAAGTYRQKPAIWELNLRVPTASGWTPAAQARFSESWLGTQGASLSRLIELAAGKSPELEALSPKMLLPPTSWGFRLDPQKWIPFLRRVGVRDGLWPTHGALVGDYPGWQWQPATVARWAGLREEDAATWIPAVERVNRNGWHRDTPYRSDALVRIPGQPDFAALDPQTRELYGRLIGAGLGTWPPSVESFGIRRPRHTNAPDEHRWPAPAWSFLEATAWVPVSRPGEPGVIDFARPRDVWHYRDDGEPQPLFAPLLAGDLRHRVAAEPTLLVRLQSLGMRLWSDPAQAGERLRLLACLLDQTDVAESQLASLRRAYERSWGQLISDGEAVPWVSSDQVEVVVSRHGQLGLFPTEGSPYERLFVLGEADRLAVSLLGSLDVPVLRVEPTDGARAAELLSPLLRDRVRVIQRGDFRVYVDGAEVNANATLPPLVAPGTEWLVDLLALALETKATHFNRQTAQTVRTAVEWLRRVRLHVGRDLHIELDGDTIPLPTFLRSVIPVPTGDDPIIAYTDPVDGLGWSTLAQVAPAIADSVGQAWAGAELRLAVDALARRAETDELYSPSEEDYSHALGESVERVAEVRRDLRSVVDDLLHMLRPVVYHLLDVDLLALITAGDVDLGSDGAIEGLLTAHEAMLPDGLTAATLVAKAREARSLAELRDDLALDYQGFNASLTALGRPYAPFHNEEGQRSAFAAHIAARHSSVANALRAAHLVAFDAGDDLPGYMTSSGELVRAMLRRSRSDASVPALEQDPNWITELDLPSDDLMDRRIDDWVRAVGARPGEGCGLLPLDDVRAANRRTVANFVERARPIIAAWTGLQTEVDPPAWARGDEPADLMERFVASGRLDFRVLSDDQVIETIGRWGEWPVGMPTTVSLTELGITAGDLDKQSSAAERSQWLRERERKTVALDGHRVSLDPSEVEDLIELVRGGITPSFLATPVRVTDLDQLGPKGGGRGSRGGGDRSPFRGVRLSEAKASTIGFIGELVAYEWLKAQFSISPADWLSSNRRLLFPDDAGDDGWGYDFQVQRRRGKPWLFEVKSSSDPGALSFELKETEIRAAQAHAGEGVYRIIFIRDVLNSPGRTVHLLPNPLDPAVQGRYRVVGTGIRYAFRLEDG